LPRRILSLALLLLCLGGITPAEQQPATPEASLDALIQRSGLDAQLVHFEAAMQRGITAAHASQQQVAPEDLRRMRRAVASAYAPSSLRGSLRAEIAKRLSSAEIAAALAWLDSPTGRKLTALEEKAASLDVQQRLESAAQSGIPPQSAARTKMLNRLVQATRADEVAASVLIETSIGLGEGLALYGPESPEATLATLRREMESERAQLVSQLHQQTFAAFALVYADATDAELAALLAFATSPAGARYHGVTSRAFANSLAQAARRLGGALAAPASLDPI
jgi:hypothetical protein